MTNPQDNTGTPLQPTPSDSSTSPPPSTTPKPRLRRVKMLARKIVNSGDLSRKLNEKLKREGKYGDEKGKGKRVVDNSPIDDLSVPSIYGVEQENVEESGKKSGGSRSGESAKGLVNLSAQGDEPGSSTEETLADLLKKVRASYDPKKRRTPTPKAPSAPKPSKKRKASSPKTTETSLPKGRATRSKVKRSESNLQKALAESKKKRMAKGKSKVAESSEAVDIEEMELIHQEKVTTVEIQTPKPKKPKTSSKQSSSVFEVAEPSLAKRTRSVVKSKQVRVSEDEEWSEEEDDKSDGK
ncbi:uncharacterized protein [Nicotiana sylvestris]|uniref:uncharacterized protein n=1 Tax=Nicotiana sylvestris TaxID=4096 RepID=UPI00388C3899